MTDTANAIARVAVPQGKVACFWLGQAGFVFKTPGGVLIATLSLAAHSSTALSPECIGELVGTAQAVSSLMGARIGERIRGRGYGEQ